MRLNRLLQKQLNTHRSMKGQFAIIVVAVCLVLVAAGTFAWFSTTDSLVNRFQSEQVNFSIKVVDIFSPPPTVTDGSSVPKEVSAKNYGNVPGLVRIMVLPTAVKDGAHKCNGEPRRNPVGNYLDSP